MGLVLWLRLGLGQEVHGQLLLLEHLLLSHASDLHRVKVNVRAGLACSWLHLRFQLQMWMQLKAVLMDSWAWLSFL